MTFRRPFDRSSIAAIAHSNAPANGHSIACHHPFHRRVPSPHTPTAMERSASLCAALAHSQLEMSGEWCGLVDERWE